jgi:tetratricopeptide (TPR) repeat protein
MPTAITNTIVSSTVKYKVVRFSVCILVVLVMGTLALKSHSQSTAQQPQSEPVEDYLDAIDRVEADYSAYSTELSDLYLGLGRSLLSNEEYQKARQAFQRGMQIERINYGLNSLSQGPYLLSIADTESYLGQWEQSQKALENLYSINRQAYGADDPRLLPVLNQILNWYLGSYPQRSANGGYTNLVISERIATRIYNIMVKTMPLNDPQAPNSFRRIGHLHYFIANHIRQHGEPSESGFTMSTAGSSNLSSKKTLSHQHFRRGKAALEKVIESTVHQENTSKRDQAVAVAELGDWYLVFGQRTSAAQTYQLAYDIIDKTEAPEQLKSELFDKPKLISFPLVEAESLSTEQEQMEVSLTVTPYGVPKNIQLVDTSADVTEKQLRALRRALGSQRFRPRIQNGDTQEAAHQLFYPVPLPKS